MGFMYGTSSLSSPSPVGKHKLLILTCHPNFSLSNFRHACLAAFVFDGTGFPALVYANSCTEVAGTSGREKKWGERCLENHIFQLNGLPTNAVSKTEKVSWMDVHLPRFQRFIFELGWPTPIIELVVVEFSCCLVSSGPWLHQLRPLHS